MRHRYALVFLVVALTTSGQEEPLPPVVPRAAPLIIDAAPVIVLAVEPFHELHTPTLIEAARANDYPTFDALYREAAARGESLTQFATLHELWTYAVTNPIGAFYGRDLYERLNRAYPGYAAFIDDYRIVDNDDNAWWPTRETRMFLVDRAVAGRAPKVQVASDRPVPTIPAPSVERRAERSAAVQAAVPPASSRPRVTPAPKAQKPVHVAATAPVVETTPVVAAPAVETAPIVATAPVVAEAPARVPARDAVEPAGKDAGVPAARAAIEPAGADASAPRDAGAPADSRGLLLLVIGIIGVGMLALMLRTPAQAVEAEKPQGTVEPIRRSAAQAPAAPSEPVEPRATGSHG